MLGDTSVREKREGFFETGRGPLGGRLIFDLSCKGRSGIIQTEKGRQGHFRQGQPHRQVLGAEKQLLGLWGYSYLGAAGMKLGVLGYKRREAGRRGSRGQVMHGLGC